MRHRFCSSTFLVFLILPFVIEAADVTGSLLYDGEPLSATFTDVVSAEATATPSEGVQIQGTVDLATSTYSFSGLQPTQYWIDVFLVRSESSGHLGQSGNLYGVTSVEPADAGDSLHHDLDVRYRFKVVSPVDSTTQLDGMIWDCYEHPAVPYPITFTIEPVPRATNYTFLAFLRLCTGSNVGLIEIDTKETTVDIEWGTADEEFQSLGVLCTGSSGIDLCTMPSVQYIDANVNYLNLRNLDSGGRGTHHSNAVVIPAVAGIAGAHQTYWSSAVSVTNLTATDRTVVITYTPRGANGLESYESTAVSLPASSQLSWSDIVADLFQTTGAGAIEILGHDLAVTSRTSTPGVSGSYGQGIPPIQPQQILSMSGTASAMMGGVEENATFRTNLGLCEVWGETVTVEITIMDSFMSTLGSRSYELRPYENIQINQVADDLGATGSVTDGIAKVTVTAGNGRIGAYLSVVDNATGDPTYIAVAPQSPAGS